MTAATADDAARSLVARIESVPFSRWHLKPRILVGSATFFDAFDALTIAFVLPVLVSVWHITPAETGFLISSSYVGQFLGALLFGWLAERYGRVPCIAGSMALMSVMAVGCALSPNFTALFVFHFIQGIGIGGEIPIAAVYINELSKGQGRGRYFLLYELTFPLGLMMTGQAGTVIVPQLGWQVMFWIGAVAGAVIALAVVRLPESPRWLIAKGRLEEAERVVWRMEKSAAKRQPPPGAWADSKTGAEESRTETESKAVAPKDPDASWRELFSSRYLGRTLVVWVLWGTTYFIANTLNNWLPTLYRTVYELPLHDALRAATLTNVAQVLVVLACALCIDRVGRRGWALASFVAVFVSTASLWVLGAADVTSVIVLATITYGIMGAMAALLVLYTPEIYPTRIRARGTGLATIWLRLASALGPSLLGLLVPRLGVAAIFLVFSGVAVVGAAAASRMIETRQRSLEDIAP